MKINTIIIQATKKNLSPIINSYKFVFLGFQ